ncbi:MAG: T9SS type A sorting domain-containing protein [Bacteroidales bacterium]|nr:T9SS type A sorting domain-containing protein [Bacteroidales bacterium]
MKTILIIAILFCINISLGAQIIYNNENDHYIYMYSMSSLPKRDTIRDIAGLGSGDFCIKVSKSLITTEYTSTLMLSVTITIDGHTNIILNPTNDKVDNFVWSDTINHESNWSANNSSSTEYNIIGPCNMANCNEPWSEAASNFIGYRYFEGVDTVYGWLRLSLYQNFDSFTAIVHDFAYQSVPGDEIFAGDGIPFCATNLVAVDNADYKDERDIWLRYSKPKIEDSISEYRVFVVQAVNAESFGLEQAEGIPTGNYMSIEPTASNYSGMIQSGTHDVLGNDIVELVPYKVFVMSVNHFGTIAQNQLSLPSNEIILKTIAPAVTNLQVQSEFVDGIDYNIRVDFDKPVNVTGLSDYRLMFILYDDLPTFDIDDAALIPSENYIPVQTGLGHYSQNFSSPELVDVNGNSLELNKKYSYCVLSVATGNPFNANSLAKSSQYFNNVNYCDTAEIVSAVVRGSDLNPGDVYLEFAGVEDESKISGYRIFLAPYSLGQGLSVEQVNNVNINNCFEVSPQGHELYQFYLPDDMMLINGEVPVANQSYSLFILTLSDMVHSNHNSLSRYPYSVKLSNPNVFYAGQTSGDYVFYTDYGDDKSIPNYDVDAIFDFDADGVDDFKINFEGGGGQGGGSHSRRLILLNGTKVLCHIKADNSAVPDHLTDSVQLNAENQWRTGTYLLSSMSWNEGGYYHTAGYWFNVQNHYLGIMIPNANDTVYGWMQLSFDNSYGAEIHDYAVYDPFHSVESDFASNNLTVYPNPSSGSFTIHYDEFIKPFEFEILDVSGRVVFKGNAIDQHTNIDLSGVKSGLYFLKTNLSNINVTKILIQ